MAIVPRRRIATRGHRNQYGTTCGRTTVAVALLAGCVGGHAGRRPGQRVFEHIHQPVGGHEANG